jgi:Fe-S oxidoreductase
VGQLRALARQRGNRQQADALARGKDAGYQQGEATPEISTYDFGRMVSVKHRQGHGRDMKKANRIAYFAGCTANYVDPDVGKSTVQVLRKCGLRPSLLDEECCGIPQLAVGNLHVFLKHAEFNV